MSWTKTKHEAFAAWCAENDGQEERLSPEEEEILHGARVGREALDEIERLKAVCQRVLAISADRQRFVMMGPQGFMEAENILREALDDAS